MFVVSLLLPAGRTGAVEVTATTSGDCVESISRVSLASDGSTQGDGDSHTGVISADGSAVAFWTLASNLHPDDTDSNADVYVRDLSSGTLTLVSRNPDGTRIAAHAFHPSLSADGSVVAFEAYNDSLDAQVYVRQVGDATSLAIASSSSAGVIADRHSGTPSLSADGRYVAFTSNATNGLHPDDDVDGWRDVFRKDLVTGQLDLVSVTASGVKGNYSSGNNEDRPTISADGNRVAFTSVATNLDPAATDFALDVFVKDLSTGALTLASENGGTGGNGESQRAMISGDGTKVAFWSSATNLIAADPDAHHDVYLKDLASGDLTLVSVDADGDTIDINDNTIGNHVAITHDGSRVAFAAKVSVFDALDSDSHADVYLKDIATGQLKLLSRALPDGAKGNHDSYFPSITGDGARVAFWSAANNLVSGDTNGRRDVFVVGACPSDGGGSAPGPIDDFDDGLDPTTWNTSQATDGMRWCNPADVWHNLATEPCSGVTQAGPYGTITESAGTVSFAADGTERTFPYVWTNDGVIPTSGDFVIQVRLRYDAISNHGSGLLLRPWADATPSGNNPPAEYQEFGALPGGSCANWSVWADSGGGLRTHLAGVAAPVASPTAYHDYVIEYVDGKYLLFIDGTLVLGPVETTLRADRLWLGNPSTTHWGVADWSDFTLDHVLITQPTFIDGDGDGTHDGDQTFAPVGVPAHTDTDGDGLPDFCDPAVAPSDGDGDGVPDSSDNCPTVPNADQADADGDGVGDACDTAADSDGDGVDDTVDNCVDTANPSQSDLDGDGVGDACDEDIDGDGLSNVIEIWLGCDPYDPDSDDDGVWDGVELVVGTNVLLSDSNPDDDDTNDGGWLLRIVREICGCSVELTDDDNGNGVFDVVEYYYFGGLYDPGTHGGGGYGTLIEYVWHLCGCGPDDTDGNGIPQAVDHHWGSGNLLRYIVHCGCTPWDDETGGGGLRIEFLNLLGGTLDEDPDGDGLLTVIELLLGCNPHEEDSDGDGLSDYDEIFVYGTDVLIPDTDGDGMLDGIEIALGCDPLDPDSDDDGKADGSDPAPLLFISACDPANVDPVRLGEAISLTFGVSGSVTGGTVDWGNGATSSISTAGSHTLSHTYTQPGVYTVTCTGTDTTGGSESLVYQYVVVYDPDGGFVTGGGWIESPAGAYTPDPSLAGKATFGFVSKYQKGASVPTGQTEFQFRVADLNFHSGTYEWLVISGSRAQYKGIGTINGEGNYGFLLTAVDGQVSGGGGVDRFRMKIWDRDDGDAVVYDNQLGDSEDAAVTTSIAGGSIVIHAAK